MSLTTGLIILQFKSINSFAYLYYFELKNPIEAEEMSEEMNQIIYHYVIPFFTNKVFAKNSIKREMLKIGTVKVVKIPNFNCDFLNISCDQNYLKSINDNAFTKRLLLTVTAHLVVCIEFWKEKYYDNNLRPDENIKWCSWSEENKFLDKILNIILYIVLNRQLYVKAN